MFFPVSNGLTLFSFVSVYICSQRVLSLLINFLLIVFYTLARLILATFTIFDAKFLLQPSISEGGSKSRARWLGLMQSRTSTQAIDGNGSKEGERHY